MIWKELRALVYNSDPSERLSLGFLLRVLFSS